MTTDTLTDPNARKYAVIDLIASNNQHRVWRVFAELPKAQAYARSSRNLQVISGYDLEEGGTVYGDSVGTTFRREASK